MFQPFEKTLWVTIIVTAVMMFALLWLFDGAKVNLFADDADVK